MYAHHIVPNIMLCNMQKNSISPICIESKRGCPHLKNIGLIIQFSSQYCTSSMLLIISKNFNLKLVMRYLVRSHWIPHCIEENIAQKVDVVDFLCTSSGCLSDIMQYLHPFGLSPLANGSNKKNRTHSYMQPQQTTNLSARIYYFPCSIHQ